MRTQPQTASTCAAVALDGPGERAGATHGDAMPLALVGILVVVVLLFAVAGALFGAAGAVLLCGVVGGCFGGPVGAGQGIVVGLVLAPVTYLLGVIVVPSEDD
jgi:hypothetical protein